MDPKILAHYRAPQRPRQFGRGTPTPRQPQRPFWPLLIYAALLGAAMVLCASTLAQRIQETIHVVL